MRLSLALAAVVALSFVAEISASAEVDLGDADFDSKLASMENVLVMFYAPW